MALHFDSVIPGLPASPAPARGRLIALLAAVFYGVFTLLPDSSSAVLSWPWVFLWQVAWICPVLWLLAMLWQGTARSLHNHLDWCVLLLIVGLLVTSAFAEFPMPARGAAWVVLCALGTLYALSSWSDSAARRHGLLIAQGYLGLAFVVVSLLLWSRETLLPELSRLDALRQQYGMALPFSFATLELRNWAPIGHQNAVAGYLVLQLPLWVALATMPVGRWRWLWWGGVGLGLLVVYTTGSRAPLLGLGVLGVVSLAIALVQGWLSRRGAMVAGAGLLGLLSLLLVANNRLREVVTHLLPQQSGGGELSYRLITNATGWEMGSRHPWTGIGLGGVPLLYQHYLPPWAGREAELIQQLHSTPAQLWAELGVWGVGVAAIAIALWLYLSVRWLRQSHPQQNPTDRLMLAVLGGLLAYGIVCLTDYQLDVVAIAGTLLVYLGVAIAAFREQTEMRQRAAGAAAAPPDDDAVVPRRRSLNLLTALAKLPIKVPLLPLAGLGILVAVIIGLVPTHRAWMLSNQGFLALRQDDINGFAQRLTQASKLAPWEPYYPYQLGWNLSDRSLNTQDPALQLRLLDDGIGWLKQGNQISPYQEFGHTNLAWLLLNQDPRAASQEFARSATLVPAKRGVFYGLGVSLLMRGQKERAIAAFGLEALRDPNFITSPIWQLKELQPLLTPVLNHAEARYTEGLSQHAQSPAQATFWHQLRGGLRWWRGDLVGAQADLETAGTPESRLVLALGAGKSVAAELAQLPDGPSKLAIAAWLNPDKRQDLLRRAWIWAEYAEPPPALLQQLVDAMGRSTSFDQWLKQNAPSRSYRRERAGFGVLSRHIDGPIPVDFLKVMENVPVTRFFDHLILRDLSFVPDLDRLLQAERQALLDQVMSAP